MAPEPERRSSPLPGWLVGVAAAGLVLVAMMPLWLWLGSPDDDSIATLGTTTVPQVATAQPGFVPTTEPNAPIATTTVPQVPTTQPDIVPTTQADANDAVRQEVIECGVNWAENLGIILDPDCNVTNVRHEDGGWTLFLYGRVPEDQMAAFEAADVSEFAATCWVNYLFVVQDGQEPIVVDSVREFTPDGEMTEICRFAPDS